MKKQLLIGLMLIASTQAFAGENNQKPSLALAAAMAAPAIIMGGLEIASLINSAILSYRGYTYYNGGVYSKGWYKCETFDVKDSSNPNLIHRFHITNIDQPLNRF